jgi:amino acid transporter
MFGVAFIGLQAPLTFFGLGTQRAAGHLALTYALCTVAMMFTAVSFGRMATAHPEAGSSYAYAGREIHPLVGYFTGWVMLLDYVLIPVVSLILVGLQLSTLIPAVPYPVWVLAAAALVTAVNVRGVQVTTGFTLGFNILSVLVLGWFVVLAVRRLLGDGALVSPAPFYDPATFSIDRVMSASALGVLSFLGFDGVATLAEEARHPARDLARATLLSCLLCGGTFVLLTYLGQRLWPDWTRFADLETAFREIGALVGGRALFLAMAGLIVLQAFTSAITSQASVSRLLYGMGREGRVPARLFCRLHPRFGTPVRGTLLVGGVAAVVPLAVSLDRAAEFVNFGACIGFAGVNLAALLRARRAWARGAARATALLCPLGGLITCLWIWTTLSWVALGLGAAWLLGGAAWLGRVTGGRFRFGAAPGPTIATLSEGTEEST